MDVFDYRASHKVNTEGVFIATGNEMEIGGLFLRLKNVMTTELHLQWDLVFLQQYISEQMVPRSLRWEVQPQQGETDPDSWFKYFNDAGISFLNVLISKKNSRLLSLDREIKELKDKLLMHKNSQEYSSLSSNLLNHLEKEDREQKHKKQKKYSRHIGDYKTNNVFSWQKLFNVASSTESLTNDMEVNLPSHAQVAPNTRVPPSNLNGGRTPRSQERQRGVSYSSQSRIRHFSPQTPRCPSRGRGNYRGKRGNRGNFRGNTQHSDIPPIAIMKISLTETMKISLIVAPRGDKGHGKIPTMKKIHTIITLLPHSPLTTGIHLSEMHTTLVTGGVITGNLHTYIILTPMGTRVFARTATPKNEVQT